jgi:hypothetical protein
MAFIKKIFLNKVKQQLSKLTLVYQVQQVLGYL